LAIFQSLLGIFQGNEFHGFLNNFLAIILFVGTLFGTANPLCLSLYKFWTAFFTGYLFASLNLLNGADEQLMGLMALPLMASSNFKPATVKSRNVP
jgi:hypothetical protein